MFFVAFFFFCSTAIAQPNMVTPLVGRYLKNQNVRIDYKTGTRYENQDLKVQNKNTKNRADQSPYFIQTEGIRTENNKETPKEISQNVIQTIKQDLPKATNQPEESFIAKTKSKFSDLFLNFKITDEEVSKRPAGPYVGFSLGLLMYGNVEVTGSEERPNTQNISNSTNNNNWLTSPTFATNKTYLPTAEIGIFVGWQLNSWIRSHLDFNWAYMYGNLSPVNTLSGSPGAAFTLPGNSFDGHMFSSTMNIFFDIYQNLKIWPTIGFGGGAAIFVFNDYNNSALLWPVANVYVGGNYMITDQIIISIGYKLQYIYTGTADNINPVHDAGGKYQDYRPTNQDQSVLFGLWLHKLEVAIRFY